MHPNMKRLISLMIHVLKLFSRIIHRRINNKTRDKFGFRKQEKRYFA